MKTGFLHKRKQRRKSAVQSLYFLNPKFQAFNHLLWLYSPVCVVPGQKPRRQFSGDTALLKQVCLYLWNHLSRIMRKPVFGVADQVRFQIIIKYEPRSEKTGLLGFRPGPTQTGLYSHRRWLEAGNFGFRK